MCDTLSKHPPNLSLLITLALWFELIRLVIFGMFYKELNMQSSKIKVVENYDFFLNVKIIKPIFFLHSR